MTTMMMTPLATMDAGGATGGGAAGSKGATSVTGATDTMAITATVTGTTTMTTMTTTDLAYHWTHGKNRRLRPFSTVREGA